MTNVRRRADSGTALAHVPVMRGSIWVTDREPAMRLLFGELLPEAEIVTPDELSTRIAGDELPDAIVVDGTQLLTLSAAHRERILGGSRVLVCTGLALTSIPMSLVAGPGVTVLAKPFSMGDLEAAIEWLRVPPPAPDVPVPALSPARPPRSGASDPAS
jgi:hypothetical protein